jgi:hypothetical protein
MHDTKITIKLDFLEVIIHFDPLSCCRSRPHLHAEYDATLAERRAGAYRPSRIKTLYIWRRPVQRQLFNMRLCLQGKLQFESDLFTAFCLRVHVRLNQNT